MRTYDTSYIKDILPFLPIEGFEPLSFILDTDNIVLTNGFDYVAFEYASWGVYTGHYFMKSKGRAALDALAKFRYELFEEHGVSLLIGYTPVENKAALWMNRQVGFRPGPIVQTPAGECQLFTMIKE